MADNNGAYPWMDNAACRNPLYDPEWWFADVSHAVDRARAMAICKRCPVRVECAQLGTGYPEGIWGGLMPEQRRTKGRATG